MENFEQVKQKEEKKEKGESLKSFYLHFQKKGLEKTSFYRYEYGFYSLAVTGMRKTIKNKLRSN